MQLLRKTGAHFTRDKLEEAGTELCRWDTREACLKTIARIVQSQIFSAIHCDPSYIVDTGTTSCPTVAQTVGMPPGSIAFDLFCWSLESASLLTHCLATVFYRAETLNRFCFNLQFQKHTLCLVRFKNVSLCLYYCKWKTLSHEARHYWFFCFDALASFSLFT